MLHTSDPDNTRTDAEKLAACNLIPAFFADKLCKITESLKAKLVCAVINLLWYDPYHQGLPLTSRLVVTAEDVQKLISMMTSKSSLLDYVPTSFIKACPAIFWKLIAHLINLSFIEGCFPRQFKQAQVMPLLERDGLDKDTSANYRPISNLITISKIIERLVLARLHQHLISSSNFNRAQSAYRRQHSIEMALFQTMNAAYWAVDRAKLLWLLLSIYPLLLYCHSFYTFKLFAWQIGVGGNALSWISSYLSGRSQIVHVGSASSTSSSCSCRVP